MKLDALDAAIKLFRTQGALAAALGIKSASISEWKQREKVPPARCADIERVTNGAVTRAQLRPDLWHEEKRAA